MLYYTAIVLDPSSVKDRKGNVQGWKIIDIYGGKYHCRLLGLKERTVVSVSDVAIAHLLFPQPEED
ncbi:hypothetical protein PN466_22200 [Roseofilum reptotaenium CS-1145]|uniref:Uncharacterized protein n=1 Tax=Roseofilum reptotaenium AO1-A TaxID=1925591 RepID=A0A1L9QSK0_9CYAN|nr:hypothetical protein [Roseofilum reptotaenium]MDB9519661.1 hypothetical protein [Roseofilum reptotaenium CS-1145]OJJ25557.1 hypothetical protein BI308_10415 [Roseofilum reptotaenium AO1-A]